MTLKDGLTIALAATALIVSMLTYLQRSGEGRSSARSRLTDILEKLAALNIEVAKARFKPEDLPSGYVMYLNDQRRLLVREADAIARDSDVSVHSFDYILIGNSLFEINEPVQAELSLQRAIELGGHPVAKGLAKRALARVLFLQGPKKAHEARAAFKSTFDIFPNENDRDLGYRLETARRWAELELEHGYTEQALEAVKFGEAETLRIKSASFRESETQRLADIRQRIERKVSLSDKTPAERG